MTPASLLAEIVGVDSRQARKYLSGQQLILDDKVRLLSRWVREHHGEIVAHEMHQAYHAVAADDFTARLGGVRPRAQLWSRFERAYENGYLPERFDLAWDQYGDGEIILIHFLRCRDGRGLAGEQYCIFERGGEVYLASQFAYNPRKGDARTVDVQEPPGFGTVQLGEIRKILYVESSANG